MTLPDCMMPDGADPCRGYAELKDENERLREDAERYRWIRDHPAWESEAFLMGLSPEEFDAALDAARKPTGKPPGRP